MLTARKLRGERERTDPTPPTDPAPHPIDEAMHLHLHGTLRATPAAREGDDAATLEAARNRSGVSLSWPLPSNATATAVQLFLSIAGPPVHRAAILLPDSNARAVDDRQADSNVTLIDDTMPCQPEAFETSPCLASNRTDTGDPARNATTAETLVGGWLRSGCDLVMKISRIARGLEWTPAQETIATITLPRCIGVLDERGQVVFDESVTARPDSHARQDIAMTFALRSRPVLASLSTRKHASESSIAESGGALDPSRQGRAASPRPSWNSPFVRMSVNSVYLGFPARDREAMTDGMSRLVKRFDEVLQGPCGTLLRLVHESRDASGRALDMSANVAAACDFVYQATSFGQVASSLGVAIEYVKSVASGVDLTREQYEKAFNILGARPDSKGAITVGREKWMSTDKGVIRLRT
ncbi:MAG TPA: hypothetical protein VL424_08675, partial [Pararobbsia sp.]|nr:hypothetical protein [Pararobbsia sp.]